VITAEGYEFKKYPTQEEAHRAGAELFNEIPDCDLDKILVMIRATEGEMPKETLDDIIKNIKLYNTIDKANRTCDLAEFISFKTENVVH
jgi:hypothetical protein